MPFKCEADSLVKFAQISAAASADVVAAVPGKKIRVLQYKVVVDAAMTVKFQSGASTDLTGAMPFAANGGSSDPYSPVGLFETAVGEKLNVVLVGAGNIAGHLSYQEV
jgi:hypothetical protein